MSKSRIAMLVVLVVMTIGAFIALGLTVAKRFPGYYMSRAEAAYARAEAAYAREDYESSQEYYESARLNLQKLLGKNPDHERGNELMSETLIEEARAAGRPTGFAANPAAVTFLAKAAKLQPDNMDLQRRVVFAYLQNPNNWGKAAEVAKPILQIEPLNADAAFALTWQAVEKQDEAKAEELFKLLENPEFTTPHVFETLALKAKFYWEMEDEEKAEATLADAKGYAERLTAEQLGLLWRRDRERMLAVLLAYQDRAKEPGEALPRAKSVIDACFKLDSQDLLDKRALANAGAQSIALFNMRFPPIELEQAHELLRDELAERVEVLGGRALESVAEAEGNRVERLEEIEARIKETETELDDAIAANARDSEIEVLEKELNDLKATKDIIEKQIAAAPMLVYWNNARTLMTQGKHDEALKVLDDGLKVADRLGAAIGNQHLDLHLLAARVLIMQRNFREANKHLDKLIGHSRFEGWSHLLKGSVALHEGKLDVAHSEFLRAKQTEGETILVRMSLARTHMAREEWVQAIDLLKSLQVPEEQLSDEERAWHHQLLGGGTRVELDLLRAHLALNRWEDAKERLTVLRDTDLAPNAYGMAVVYLWDEAKDKERAKLYLQATRDKYPQELSLVLLDARIKKESGELAQATQVVEEYAAGKPADELAQLALARWYVRNKEPEKAIALLDRVKAIPDLTNKAANTVAVYRVQALLGLKRIDEAKVEADALIANPGTATAGNLFRAAISFAERNEKDGVRYLEAAQEANPDNPALNLMLTRIRQQQGDFEGALENMVGVSGITKYEGQFRASVSDALRRIAQESGPEKALAEVDKMLAKRPGDLTLTKLKVELLIQRNQFKEAFDVLDLAETAAPNDPKMPQLKAQLYLARAAQFAAQGDPATAQSEYNRAIPEVNKALQLDPQSADIQALAAQANIGAGRYEEAIKNSQNTVRLDPNSPRGYLLLADSYRKSDESNKAISVLMVFAKKNPRDFAIHKTITDLHVEAGDINSALNYIKQASIANPNDMRFFVTELELLLAHDRQDDARLRASEKIAQAKDAVEILVVAQTFAGAEEYTDAAQWGERAVVAAGSNLAQRATANSFLGRIYLKQQSYERARSYFEAVRKDRPDDLVAGNNLAWILSTNLGQPDAAVRVIEDVQVRNNAAIEQLPIEFIDTMVEVYVNAKKPEKAKDVLKQALRKYPRASNLLYRMGLLLKDEQPSQAKDMLSRAVELGLPAEDEAEAKRQLNRL